MANTNKAIYQIFTRKVIGGLLNNGANEVFDTVVRRYINDPESKTHGEIIGKIYAILGKKKRNEYYYMNTLLNKLLVGIHNVNTTTALTQVHIGQHIADFVMINGEGRVYEIKSDLDNLDRLNNQLYDYYKAFSKVSVLTSPREAKKVERILASLGDMGDAVGIYVLSEQDTIFSRTNSREPHQFDDFLNHEYIFKLLRKGEYENIIKAYYGKLPQVAPVFQFRSCLEWFSKMPILLAQRLAFDKLRKRNRISKTAFESVQNELKCVCYFTPLSHKLPDLTKLLKIRYKGKEDYNVLSVF
jgi:hypothetical protein